MQAEQKPRDDVWISTACAMCYSACSIKAHRVDGVIVKLEGNPASPVGQGRMCPKGVSGIMVLYDPHRLKVPLKRTNPQKGIGIDPGWQEISWEEAYSIVAAELKKAMDEDPRTIHCMDTTTTGFTAWMLPFHAALGTPNFSAAGGGLHCGNAAHLLGGVFHASWSLVPDYQYCNYALYFGCSKGHAAGHVANANGQMAADARARGIKMVVVDPYCSFAASKASEWVPIRPGTDAAMALAMVNLLLNEYGLYDAPYLQTKTNAPYLIGPDGRYVREGGDGEPLVWDAADGTVKKHNDPTVKDLALEGTYQVNGVTCTPAFVLLKEHVKKYTPELAEEITSVPASTVRRVAREFGEQARIGSTIVIDGVTVPYRPAAAIFFRGVQGHKNGVYNCVSIELLNQIVGCADMVGGALGFNPASFGHPDTGQPYYLPKPGRDGLMVVGSWVNPHHLPYPPSEPREPESIGLRELFPLGMTSTFIYSSDQEDLWQKVDLPYRPKVLVNWGSNPVMSVGNKDVVADGLKKYRFIVSIDLFITETSELADVVFPDRMYLERYWPSVVKGIFNLPAGLGEWCWAVRTPAVEDPVAPYDGVEILLELARRVGVLEEYHGNINGMQKLRGEYKLDGTPVSWREICDRILKNNFGAERGLDWFKQHDGVVTWPKRVEETYWRAFTEARVPVYMEFFQTSGEQVKALADRYGIPFDFRHFAPLPEWFPCPSHEEKDPQFDLWAFYYREVLHTNSFTMENPWLDEASLMNPYTYNIAINTETALQKGLKNGDIVWVESPHGRRVKGKLAVTEGVHPDALAFAACAGHWTDKQPIAKGKGIFFNELLEIDLEHTDPMSAGLDICVKVKVYRA